MARNFVGNFSTDFLQIDSSLISALPVSVSVWVDPDNLTTENTIWWLGDSSLATHGLMLAFSGATALDPVRAIAFNSTSAVATTANAYNVGVWNHAVAIFASSTDRSVILNGDIANKGTNATSKSVTSFNRTCFGRRADSTPSDPHFGAIAECGMWDIALTDAEVIMLSKGVSPIYVRPQNLVSYWPLLGRSSPDRDLVGRQELTVNGTTTVPHTRVFNLGRDQLRRSTAAGGPTLKALTGTLTTAGAIIKADSRALLGTLTTAGAALKREARALAGTLTTAGALGTIKAALKSVAGTLTTAGALLKAEAKVVAGVLSTAGALIKQPRRALTGAIATAGAMAAVLTGASAGVAYTLLMGGTLGLSSVLGFSTTRRLTGVLSFAGHTFGHILATLETFIDLIVHPVLRYSHMINVRVKKYHP